MSVVLGTVDCSVAFRYDLWSVLTSIELRASLSNFSASTEKKCWYCFHLWGLCRFGINVGDELKRIIVLSSYVFLRMINREYRAWLDPLIVIFYYTCFKSHKEKALIKMIVRYKKALNFTIIRGIVIKWCGLLNKFQSTH